MCHGASGVTQPLGALRQSVPYLKFFFGDLPPRRQKNFRSVYHFGSQKLFPDIPYLLRRPSKKIKLVRNEPKGLRTNFPKWREATNQIIFNISFYQNNIIIKVFNYFWYRPLFVSAIYIKTVNTEQTSIHNDL